MRLPPLAPDATFAQLVVDADEPEARRFRRAAALADAPEVDSSGLAELGCSGSGQFSLAGWRELQEKLGPLPPGALYVIDLRQEPHGFLNGAAVSWYAQRNWGCVGLSDEEVLQLEALRLRLLGLSQGVWVGHVRDVKDGTARNLTEWKVESAVSEEQALGLPAGHYLRLPVIDHLRPSDGVVDRFLLFVRALRGQAHLHFHCRGGKGRTSTFLALYDMLRNAERLPLEVILERQRLLSGYDLSSPASAESPKAPYIAERWDFITRFHRYARENPGGEPLLWTRWLSQRG
ncbi:phosphatase domain-containing protein [Hyalangium gracile]|uniref:phosphatase domain-containing protein n=1 Tax=Hyalangium gracile TaxID=394092 RepID=UPI001CCC1F50|nr:protein tyrosine phosphatase [Hyalangium gracile]